MHLDRYLYFNFHYTYKMNIKINLLEDYVNFVHLTKKQNEYFKVSIILFVVSLCLFFLFCLNMTQSIIRTIILIIRV